MAKQYRKQNGLFLADDSLALATPDHAPWYAGRLNQTRQAVQFYPSGTVLFVPSGTVAMDPACCCETTDCAACGIPAELTANIDLTWADNNCGDCDAIPDGNYILQNPPPGALCPPDFLVRVCEWRYIESRNCNGESSYFAVSVWIPNTDGVIAYPVTVWLSVSYKRCDNGSTSGENWTATATSCEDLLTQLAAGMNFTHNDNTSSGSSPPCTVNANANATVTS